MRAEKKKKEFQKRKREGKRNVGLKKNGKRKVERMARFAKMDLHRSVRGATEAGRVLNRPQMHGAR